MPSWSLSAPEMDRPLSGPDHFHWLVHRAMRKRGLAGNVSRMRFDLGAGADPGAVAAALRANPVVQQVARIRWRVGWPWLPRWCTLEHAPDIVHLHGGEDAGAWLTERLGDRLGAEGLLRFDVLAAAGRTQVLVSFHHALFDHQGMLNLLHALESGGWTGPLLPPEDRAAAPGAWRDVVAGAAQAFRTSGPRLGSLWVGERTVPPVPRFRVLRFTAEETARIDDQARSTGAALARSAHFMAAAARAVNGVLDRRGSLPRYLWFSAPVDQRPRGGQGHLLTNVTSFLFFRLEQEQLHDTATAVRALNGQLVEQVRARFPQRYRALLRAFRHLPAWLSAAMVDLPSLGRWSSFGFSDLGDLDRMPTTFTGRPVLEVLHLPPVPAPPGLSVVVGRERGALLLVLGYDGRALNEDEADRFASGLRSLLLGA